MAVRYGKFEMPQKLIVDRSSETACFTRYIAEPFEKGAGVSVGNTLRRFLLSSLEAPAIVSVSVEGVPHEFSAIEGVVEDMTNIILNLKGALLRKLPLDDQPHSHDTRIMTKLLEVTQEDLDQSGGTKEITLEDLVQEGLFELVNPKHHLFTVTRPMSRQINLRVAFGRGYVPSERQQLRDVAFHEIVMDAAYSPVRLVNYYVENTRVGQDTDFDQLVLEISTDGRITPAEALSFSVQIALKHFAVFADFGEHELAFDEKTDHLEGSEDELLDKLCLEIPEIEFSVRSANCLKTANIHTIAELVLISDREMLNFRNFGKKSLNEIKAKLHEMGLYLGMDLSRFGLDAENVKEKIQVCREEKKKKESSQGDRSEKELKSDE